MSHCRQMSVAWLMVDHVARWGWMVKTTPLSIYPRERDPYQLWRRLSGTRGCVDGCAERTNNWPYPNSNPEPSSPWRGPINSALCSWGSLDSKTTSSWTKRVRECVRGMKFLLWHTCAWLCEQLGPWLTKKWAYVKKIVVYNNQLSTSAQQFCYC